jgi:hypothetical protein
MEHFIVVKPYSTVMPVGYILQGAGLNNVPCLLPCDGQALDKVQYAELYGAIGLTYGGSNNSSTFNIPDLRPNQILTDLIYQEYWETWPCINCGKIFSNGHDRSTWWCREQANKASYFTMYNPMDNLEYLEMKVEKGNA